MKIERYENVMIFLGVTFIGTAIYYCEKKGEVWGGLWELINTVGVASTIALALLALMAYIEYIKSEDEIEIKFQPIDFKSTESDSNGNIKTGLTVLRKNCTRSEIQGLLGMIFNDYHGRHRYDLKDFLTNNGNILKTIHNAQMGNSNEVIIKITKVELKQFNIKK